jgi:hypothetical protein
MFIGVLISIFSNVRVLFEYIERPLEGKVIKGRRVELRPKKVRCFDIVSGVVSKLPETVG